MTSNASERLRVLIGPAANDPAESVSVVNRAFVAGLGDRYEFLLLPADRTLGLTRQRALNVINLYYFLKQLALWTFRLIRFRPPIVHYAVTDGWGMEKGFVFFRLGSLFGAKTLGHFHSGLFLPFWEALPAWRKKNALRELRRLDGIVLLSEGWKEQVQKNIAVQADRLFVVNNPIDGAFEQSALRIPLERADGSVLCLGALERPKGVVDLLQAAEMARSQADFVLQFAGPEREAGLVRWMKEYICSHSLTETVQVRSGVWGQDKIDLFTRCNIFVLPSYFENFPLVLLEAAAAGMAIIATPVGAVPEFFEDGVSAVFVEPGNVHQLAEAIRSLVLSPEKRLRLATAARDVFINRLRRSRIMNSLDEVYKEIQQRTGSELA